MVDRKGHLLLFLFFFLACSSSVSCQEAGRLPYLGPPNLQEITPEEIQDVLTIFHEMFPKLLSEQANSSLKCADAWEKLEKEKYTQKTGGRSLSVNATTAVFDSFGKPGSGILEGNTAFQGSFDECLSIKTSVPMNYSLMGIAVVRTADESPIFVFYEGLCVPTICTPSDIFEVVHQMNESLEMFNLSLFVNETVSDGQQFFMSTPQSGRPYDAGAIVMITLCFILLFLALVGSVFDLALKYFDDPQNQCNKTELTTSQDNTVTPEHSLETDSLLGSKVKKPSRMFGKRFKTFLKECLLGFSLYKNVPVVLSTYQPPAAITNLNGMRVISMFWVILGHTYVFILMVGGFKNINFVVSSFIPRFTAQAVTNAFFAVDSFFYISGFLVAYLTLREMKRRNGSFPYITYYLHRILRLTPTYMFVLFFYWFLSVYLGKGPRTPSIAGPDSLAYKYCSSYWWTNLLYINNFYPSNFGEQCMGWAWYLANDMQFFVITPLFLIVLYASFRIGLVSIGITLAASMGVTGFIAGFYGYPANEIYDLYAGITPNASIPDMNNQIYGKPYCRIGPYLIGILCGYIIFKNYQTTFSKQLNWIFHLVLWGHAIIIGMSVVYGFYGNFRGHEVSKAGDVVYFMLSRPAWGVALAIVTYTCHYGYGGVINRFLSLPFWVPLGRLTFNAYLVHEILLVVFYSELREPISYGDTTMTIFCIGIVVLSYGAAGLVTVFVEFPVSNIEIAAFKLFGAKIRESTRIIGQETNTTTNSNEVKK
ncbi:PREDICTED: O-acyltransferase like protein-like [Amphimedon queenslandica]|uniref:Nose resistant-to-fluoxetine protein N-terminal domain-containing protein n=1 Tax=Amphimedon queenslandica TaxID=400682 RepID=A0A1X7VCM1_AMPQE|nr:PREDICTED: O-acyltransferase like protein-like [Amphimedon queenslandica]|eukprot:XP_003384838.1 PREDICTED: O-acyltransferase like protein-like [Amphimedon queenslandica]